VHPDRVHSLDPGQRAAAQKTYVLLNGAHQSLSRHRDRLKHLIELETGRPPENIDSVPADLIVHFTSIGKELRESDKLLSEKEEVNSPILRVQVFERAQQQIDRLQAWQGSIRAAQEGAEADLRAIDRDWVETPAGAHRAALVRRLEELRHRFGYLEKWRNQVQERIVRLSF
jgi:hypothetical protein